MKELKDKIDRLMIKIGDLEKENERLNSDNAELEFQLRDKSNGEVEEDVSLKDIGHHLTAVFYELSHETCKSPYDEKEFIKTMIRSYSTSQIKKKVEEVKGWLIEREIDGTHLIEFQDGTFFWTYSRYNEIPMQFDSKEDARAYISNYFTEEESKQLNTIYFPN